MEIKDEKSASFPSIYKRVYQCSVLTAFLKGADVASVILVAVAYVSGTIILRLVILTIMALSPDS